MGVYLRVITPPSANDRTETEGTFVRSSNKMPMAVRVAIKNAAIKVGNMSEEEASDFLFWMERGRRLIEETWS